MLYEQCVNVYMDECECKWVLKGQNPFYYVTATMQNIIHCMIMYELMSSVMVATEQISDNADTLEAFSISEYVNNGKKG